MIVVRPVTDRAGRAAFERVHRVVHPRAAAWQRDESADFPDLLRDGNGRAQAFVAYDGTAPVGRIVALADPALGGIGGFGFYEAVDAQAVASALLDATAQWARQRSLVRLRGPLNPSIHHAAGLLTSDFDRPALVGMPHNPAYYCDQVTRWGLAPAKDLQSWTLTGELSAVVARTGAARDRLRDAVPITCRSLDLTRFAEEVEAVRHLYNTAFVRFWGFTPMDREGFLELATGYRPLLDPELVVLAEQDGRTVGCLMAVPDVNQALARAGRWRSAPARAVATLWHWKGPGRRRTVSSVRMDMLMVHPQTASRGLGRLLVLELLRRIDERGYSAVEGGPVLEGSAWLSSIGSMLGIELSRTHRVYECELAAA